VCVCVCVCVFVFLNTGTVCWCSCGLCVEEGCKEAFLSLIFLVKKENTLQTCLAVQQADTSVCTITSHEASNVELETVLGDRQLLLFCIMYVCMYV
jgi:hypothetical protein